jgi:hypothetical protein
LIVYVETNFLGELIRKQEHYDSCAALLKLAEDSAIDLRIPAYSMIEIGDVTARLRKEYEDLIGKVDRKLNDFRRGEATRRFVDDVNRSRLALVAIMNEEDENMWAVRERVRRIATQLPLDARASKVENHILAPAEILREKPGDRAVLASIRADLATHRSESIFITRDSDLRTRDIRSILRRHGCRVFASYHDAVGFLQERA